MGLVFCWVFLFLVWGGFWKFGGGCGGGLVLGFFSFKSFSIDFSKAEKDNHPDHLLSENTRALVNHFSKPQLQKKTQTKQKKQNHNSKPKLWEKKIWKLCPGSKSALSRFCKTPGLLNRRMHMHTASQGEKKGMPPPKDAHCPAQSPELLPLLPPVVVPKQATLGTAGMDKQGLPDLPSLPL